MAQQDRNKQKSSNGWSTQADTTHGHIIVKVGSFGVTVDGEAVAMDNNGYITFIQAPFSATSGGIIADSCAFTVNDDVAPTLLSICPSSDGMILKFARPPANRQPQSEKAKSEVD